MKDTPELVRRRLAQEEKNIDFEHATYYTVGGYKFDKRCLKFGATLGLSATCVIVSTIRILSGDVSPVFISLLSSQVGLWLPSPSI